MLPEYSKASKQQSKERCCEMGGEIFRVIKSPRNVWWVVIAASQPPKKIAAEVVFLSKLCLGGKEK